MCAGQRDVICAVCVVVCMRAAPLVQCGGMSTDCTAMRAGQRDIRRRRRRPVITSAACLTTGTGSHVTLRRARCRVDTRVVDVAVDEAQQCASGGDISSQLSLLSQQGRK